jgi:hypothetical protein
LIHHNETEDEMPLAAPIGIQEFRCHDLRLLPLSLVSLYFTSLAWNPCLEIAHPAFGIGEPVRQLATRSGSLRNPLGLRGLCLIFGRK